MQRSVAAESGNGEWQRRVASVEPYLDGLATRIERTLLATRGNFSGVAGVDGSC